MLATTVTPARGPRQGRRTFQGRPMLTGVGPRSTPELIDTVLSLVPDAALVVDRQGEITHVNGALTELFGYDEDELVGQQIEVLLPERLRTGHRVHRSGYAADPTPR